jgi:hypothetical protein
MTKQAINISVPFDPDTTGRQLAMALEAHAEQAAKKMAANLFATPHERRSPYLQKDAQTGIMYDRLQAMVNDQALTEKWEQYARSYIEQNFQAALDRALDTAIEHSARRVAFEQTAKETKR